MADKVFVISIDLADPTLDFGKLKAFIRDGGLFPKWWNHIPGTSLVVSSLTADEISNRIKPFVGSSRFLVMRANPAESQGWLPERAWRWIQSREAPQATTAAE
jgi:hypothetical protein